MCTKSVGCSSITPGHQDFYLNITQYPELEWRERIIIRNFVHQICKDSQRFISSNTPYPKLKQETIIMYKIQKGYNTPPGAYGLTSTGLKIRSDLSSLNQRRLFGSFALRRGKENTLLSDPLAKCSQSESAWNEIFVLQ